MKSDGPQDSSRVLSREKTLAAHWYRDAAVLEREKERIFARTWQVLARDDAVRAPGAHCTVDLLGEPLVLVRGEDSAIRCFYNVCRHRAGPVAEGAGTSDALACRYHGWTYSLDGRLIRTPGFCPSAGFRPSAHGLRAVPMSSWRGFIFASLEPNPGTLDEFLGPLPDRVRHIPIEQMRFVKRQEYVVACNWKVYVDNFMEGYHLETVHELLRGRLDYESYRVDPYRFCSEHHLLPSPPPDGPAREQEAHRFFVFPNLRFNIYPDSLSVNVILPLDALRTRVVFDWYHLHPESEEVRRSVDEMLEFSDAIQQEDISICEAVQRGLSSRGYDSGPYSEKFEVGLRHFHSLVEEFIA